MNPHTVVSMARIAQNIIDKKKMTTGWWQSPNNNRDKFGIDNNVNKTNENNSSRNIMEMIKTIEEIGAVAIIDTPSFLNSFFLNILLFASTTK